jgi:hypothetical protein
LPLKVKTSAMVQQAVQDGRGADQVTHPVSLQLSGRHLSRIALNPQSRAAPEYVERPLCVGTWSESSISPIQFRFN